MEGDQRVWGALRVICALVGQRELQLVLELGFTVLGRKSRAQL